MRLHIGPGVTRIGNVTIHEAFRVTELDAGHCVAANTSGAANCTYGHSNVPFSHESLHAIESQLAIVIPCMDEELGILDGVLHGVPHECLIILVSNSKATNFQAECLLLTYFCEATQRHGVAIHQKDKGLADAFRVARMPEMVLETPVTQTKRKVDTRIRNGKGEAMMIGVAIAKVAGSHFVGFIDADNFVAGSVHEYCKVYAAGLHFALQGTGTSTSYSSEDSYAMVRVKWNSKPKVKDGKLVFEKSGRCSRVVNEWMNRLLNALAGNVDQNNIIETSNAGEHAMSLNLAMKLRFATGYAVEPFQLINAWEQFGAQSDKGILYPTIQESGDCDQSQRSPKVQVLQIETRSPHFHDCSKGAEHIQRMQVQGLSTIYHSDLTSLKLKDELGAFMKAQFPDAVGADGTPERTRDYPPMETVDFKVFGVALKVYGCNITVVGPVLELFGECIASRTDLIEGLPL